MKKMTILGIGSPLMMDDGIGPYLVKRLEKENNNPNASYAIGETDLDYCINVIKESCFTVFIDAVNSGETPGTVSVYKMNDLVQKPGLSISLHNFHLFDLLKGFRQDISGILIGIQPAVIDYHFGLSPILQERIDEIYTKVNMIITGIHKPE